VRVPAAVLPLCLMAFAPSAAHALERALVRDPGEDTTWHRAGDCSAFYFNNCTAWSWLWGLGPGDEANVTYQFDICSDGGSAIYDIGMRFRDDSPPGYGYTGTVTVRSADADGCPTGPVLDERPLLPHHGWNWVQTLVIGPSRAVVTFTAGPGGLPSRLYSDFTNGTGYPQACGICYSTHRAPHSYRRFASDGVSGKRSKQATATPSGSGLCRAPSSRPVSTS